MRIFFLTDYDFGKAEVPGDPWVPGQLTHLEYLPGNLSQHPARRGYGSPS